MKSATTCRCTVQPTPEATSRRRWPTCRWERSSARWCTRCWRPPIRSPPTWRAELETHIREHSVWWPVDVAPDELAAAMVPMHDTLLGPLAPGATLRQIGLRDRLREMDFEFPLAGGDARGAAPSISIGRCRPAAFGTPPCRRPAGVLRAAAVQRRIGHAVAEGVSDGVAGCGAAGPRRSRGPIPGRRLQDELAGRAGPAADGRRLRPGREWPRRCCIRTIRCRRCCTALCCIGSCAGDCRGTHPTSTWVACCICSCAGCAARRRPIVDGHPAGVFSWRPPAALIVAISDLLDAGAVAA